MIDTIGLDKHLERNLFRVSEIVIQGILEYDGVLADL